MVSRNKSLYFLAILLITTIIANAVVYSETTVEDALHRTVVLKKTPERVVSLAPSITEILFALDLEEYIVGVDSISYNDTFFGISSYVREKNVVDVGGYWWSTISLEKIISLEPDLVLADAGAHYKLLEAFNEYNITVVYLYGGSARSIQDIYHDIDLVRRIFGLDENIVASLIDDIEENLTKARQVINNINLNGTLKIVVIVGFYQGIWVAGKLTFIDDLISRIGLENAADKIGWYVVNIEDLLSMDPDLIIVTNMGYVTNETLKEYGLLDLGKPVILLSTRETDLLVRPGPLIGWGALELSKRIAEYYGGQVTRTPTVTEKTVTHTETVTETITNTITETITNTITNTITETETETVTVVQETYQINYLVAGLIVAVSLAVGFVIGLKLKR